MAEVNWTTILSGAVGFVTGAGGTTLLQHILKDRDRKREENASFTRSILKLVSEMQVAESQYRRFLSETIYSMSDGDAYVVRPPETHKPLIILIDQFPLHLLKGSLSDHLARHASDFSSLSIELEAIQADLNLDYADPVDLTSHARRHLERQFSDILFQFHSLRRLLKVRYLGRPSWTLSDKKSGREINRLRSRAHLTVNLSDRLQTFRDWVSLKVFKGRAKLRRWLRTV
jgi:hypothetical protein